MLRLWFGCIYPWESFFEIQAFDAVLDRVMPRINHHIQHCYESLCRDYARKHLAPQTQTLKVGRQWGAHYEFDLVGVDASNRITLVGECKWSTHPVGLSLLQKLEAAADAQKLPLTPDSRWVLFSRAGFTQPLIEHAASRPNLSLI